MAFYIDPRIGAYTVGLFVEKCWQVRARCAACGHAARLGVGKLIELPQDALIGDVVARLKCSECGGAEGHADYLQDPGASQAKQMAEYRARVKPGDKQ